MANFREKLREAGTGKKPAAASLGFLSDMNSEDRASFREVWPTLSEKRREEIIRTLTTLSEDNIELDFRHVFLTALDDASPVVRVLAVEGLFEDESSMLLRRLIELLRNDPDSDVRKAAATALGRFTYLAQCNKLGDDARTAALRAALIEATRKSDEHSDVSRRAIEALGYFHDDPEVQDLVAQAYSKGGKQAESALFAMGRSMDSRWQPTVLEELNSTQPPMRYEAAHAAGEMALQQALPRLIQLVGDPDLEVRLAAIWALGQIGGKQAAQALSQVLQNDDPAMRDAAQEALDEIAFAANPLNVLGS